MDAIEKIQNGFDAFEVLREEIIKVRDIETGCFIDELVYDKEIGKKTTYVYNAYDDIKKAKIEKIIIEELPRVMSKTFKFEVSKIRSYNEIFDEVSKKHKDAYYLYREEIKGLFLENDKDGLLTFFLSHKYILLSVDFVVNYTQKDADNVLKPFIDFLYYNVTADDNNIKKLNVSIEKNEDNNDEFIYFNITVLNKADIQRSSLSKQYIKENNL